MFSTTKGRKKLVFGIFWLGFVFFLIEFFHKKHHGQANSALLGFLLHHV